MAAVLPTAEDIRSRALDKVRVDMITSIETSADEGHGNVRFMFPKWRPMNVKPLAQELYDAGYFVRLLSDSILIRWDVSADLVTESRPEGDEEVERERFKR